MSFSSWGEGGVGQWWGHAATQHGKQVLPALSVKGQELGLEGEGGSGLLLWWFLNDFATCHSLGHGGLAFQLQYSAFPRETWAVLPQSTVFPAGLCPVWTLHSPQGWMMVPRVASSTPGTAASTSDRALLCVTPGLKGFTQENTRHCGTALESAPRMSITGPAAALHRTKGRTPVSFLPPALPQGAAAF